MTPIDDIGKMVNIGTLLAFVIVCIAIMVLRKTDPDKGAAVPHAVGSVCAGDGHPVQRLHDGEAGLAELGSADRLACNRVDGLLHLQREAQQGS